MHASHVRAEGESVRKSLIFPVVAVYWLAFASSRHTLTPRARVLAERASPHEASSPTLSSHQGFFRNQEQRCAEVCSSE